MAISKAELKKQADLENSIKEKLAARIGKTMDEHQAKIDASHAMFKNTRVTSCSQVLQKNGKNVCMAFNVGAAKPVNPNANKLPETTSMAAEQFKVRDNLHAGMVKKPLQPYHPNAFRNRLPQPTVVMPYKNSSQIVIGDRSTYNKKQFVSSNQNMYAKPKPHESSNQGIISAQTSMMKHLQNQ